MTSLNERQTNRLLGYPDDARLLIINADDFGMSHSSNAATMHALKEGVVSSATLMAPCPWAPHAMQMLRENADIPFGVHLTAICDFSNYRWGPLTSGERVPSLIDDAGYFYSGDHIPELLAQARLSELEVEFRAQIEAVLAAQLTPTHLDWHCLADGGRADVFEMTLRLAREYGLALRIHDRSLAERCRRESLPTTDYDVLDSYRLDTVNKLALYAELMRALPAGLTEWAVHPGLGNDESRALEPETWRVRRADFDFMISQDARDIVEEEGIVLLDHRALQNIWSRKDVDRT